MFTKIFPLLFVLARWLLCTNCNPQILKLCATKSKTKRTTKNVTIENIQDYENIYLFFNVVCFKIFMWKISHFFQWYKSILWRRKWYIFYWILYMLFRKFTATNFTILEQKNVKRNQFSQIFYTFLVNFLRQDKKNIKLRWPITVN